MPNHHASLCQCSLFLLHFECTTFPALRQHYHGLTSRTTSVLASDPHFSMRSEGKRLQHQEVKKAALALSFPHTLPFCPSALQHWQDLVALGSFCANNILDQSSLVIGQRGFKQREKKKLLSQAEISRAARFNRFSEGVTFAVVSRAFGGGGDWGATRPRIIECILLNLWADCSVALAFQKWDATAFWVFCIAEIWILRSTYILGCKWFIISNTQFIRYSWEPYRGELQLDWSFLMNPSTKVSVTEHTHVRLLHASSCLIYEEVCEFPSCLVFWIHVCLILPQEWQPTWDKSLCSLSPITCVCVWVCV